MKLHRHHRQSFVRAFLLTGVLASASAKDVMVQGVVSGTDRAGLTDIVVRAEKDGKVLGSTKTAGGGTYTFVVKDAADFDLTYSSTAHYPNVLEKLSTERDHSINKVLYKLGEETEMSVTDLSDAMNSYEYLVITGQANSHALGGGANKLAADLDRIGTVVSVWDGKFSSYLRNKYNLVRGLVPMK